ARGPPMRLSRARVSMPRGTAWRLGCARLMAAPRDALASRVAGLLQPRELPIAKPVTPGAKVGGGCAAACVTVAWPAQTSGSPGAFVTRRTELDEAEHAAGRVSAAELHAALQTLQRDGSLALPRLAAQLGVDEATLRRLAERLEPL